MVVRGLANLVGTRSGKSKDRDWCSVTLDAIDDPLERVQYFVPDELINKVKGIPTGEVYVEVRIYPMRDNLFGSRLIDIKPASKGGETK